MNSKLKKGLTIGSIAFAAVLVVTVVILLIVGITSHNEVTFASTCVHGDEVRYFEDSADPPSRMNESPSTVTCEAGTEPLWTKASFPLTVTALSHEGGVLPDGHEAWRSVDQAIADVNSQFGFHVFQKVSSGDPSVVTIFWGVPYEEGPLGRAAGYAFHFYERSTETDLGARSSPCDPNGLCAHVGLRSVGSERFSYIVLIHELGHVLFLGHDDYTSSVMFPLSTDDSDQATLTNWTRFSDMDVEAVRENFAP